MYEELKESEKKFFFLKSEMVIKSSGVEKQCFFYGTVKITLYNMMIKYIHKQVTQKC
jgi:hypothetical protein